MDRCPSCRQAVQLFEDGLCFHCSPIFQASSRQRSTTNTSSETKPRPVMTRPAGPAALPQPTPPGEPSSAVAEGLRKLAALVAVSAALTAGFVFIGRNANSSEGSSPRTQSSSYGASGDLGSTYEATPSYSATTAPSTTLSGFSDSEVRAQAAESAFIVSIDREGVPYRSRATAIELGKVACESVTIARGNGLDKTTAKLGLAEQYAQVGTLTYRQAVAVVSAAAATFCPEHKGY